MAFNQPQGFHPGLGQSNPNNFYASGIAASQLNGTGSQVQANKLNRNKNAAGVTVVPGPVQYVEQPVEVIKKVKKQVYAQTAAPVVQVNQLDSTLKDMIAETTAKMALLVMENNRIKWRISQRDAEIARLRSQGGSHVVTTNAAPVFRTSGTAVTSTVVNRAPVISTVNTGPVVTTGQVISRPVTTYPGTIQTTGLPTTTVVSTGGVPVNSTVRPVTTFGQPR